MACSLIYILSFFIKRKSRFYDVLRSLEQTLKNFKLFGSFVGAGGSAFLRFDNLRKVVGYNYH